MAHRGASRAARENTLEAFLTAVEMGADWIELDVRLLADGALAVHHDARLPDGRAVSECRAVDLPDHVPLFAEALVACTGARVNVEIKNSPGEPGYDRSSAVVPLVAAGLTGGELISCFNWDTLMHWRACAPDVPCAFLTMAPVTRRVIRRCGDAGLVAVHPWNAITTADLIKGAHAASLRVHVWTVDDPKRMRQLIDWGVDGICTNTPDVLRSVLDRS
jgi:glycerophosphoryl diester phosphodiesterase